MKITSAIQWIPVLALPRVVLAAVLMVSSTAAFSQSEPDFPTLDSRVVDAANLLDEAAEAKLDSQLEAHEQQTSNQIVVVTVNSLQGYDVADYALRLGRKWGIGTEERNNGVILLVAPNEREVRIEVGYGLEGALPDGLAGQIIRHNVLPSFRESEYPAGIQNGVDSILLAIAGEYEAPATATSPRGTGGVGSAGHPLNNAIPLIFLAMVALPALLRRLGRHKAANGAFPAGFVGLFTTLSSGNLIIGAVAALAIFLMLYFFNSGSGGGGSGSSSARRTGGYIGGLGGGGGMGGGGGFSGGGGSFGGGGASGSW